MTVAAPERRVYRVSDVLGGVRRLLEDRVGRLWVVGEISNLFRAASGHLYFTLKDAGGQMKAVLFRATAQRLPFDLEEGLEVTVYAELTVYEPRGDLQLVVRLVEPQGHGALQLAFEQLRRRLEAEGLFAQDRKRALPAWPRRVGVVTSLAGAVLRDVIQVTGARFPSIPLLLSPTRVQGEGAESEIAEALDRVAAAPGVDVVLLVRGGGSLEDLAAFNSEWVARAVARCPVPVVSGVGHESDFSIADAVADARAATPSVAAAMVLPDRAQLSAGLRAANRRLAAAGASQLRALHNHLDREADALRVLAPSARLGAGRARLRGLARALQRLLLAEGQRRGSRLAGATMRLAGATPDVEHRRLQGLAARRRLHRAAAGLAERRRASLREQVGRLDSLSPMAVLSRGYALVRTPDGRLVRSASDVAAGDRLILRVAEAEIDARTEAVRPTRDSS